MKTDDWKKHFARMAGGKALGQTDEIYIVKSEQGRGLGRQAFGNSVYKIRPASNDTEPKTSDIISPVAEVVAQAKALTSSKKQYVKKTGIVKKKSIKKKTSKKKVTKKKPRKNRKY